MCKKNYGKPKIPVLVVFAPTACGKTALAEDLFAKSSFSSFKGRAEVISADSQSVYIGMDVGTAKPSKEELEQLPHHLINLVTPDVQFGAGDFLPLADKKCEEIFSRNKLPVVLGGTGFYIRNFIFGLPKTPESDPLLRQSLMDEAKKNGNKELFAELKKVDPVYAEKINPADSYRICRALEVFKLTGKPLSSVEIPSVPREKYNFKIIILTRDRKSLYERIDLRVEKMFADGLPEEVERLKKSGLTAQSPGMKAIGYREFFAENSSLESIKNQIKFDSHRYAKRQYTFMKEIPNAEIFDADNKTELEKSILDFCASVLN